MSFGIFKVFNLILVFVFIIVLIQDSHNAV